MHSTVERSVGASFGWQTGGFWGSGGVYTLKFLRRPNPRFGDLNLVLEKSGVILCGDFLMGFSFPFQEWRFSFVHGRFSFPENVQIWSKYTRTQKKCLKTNLCQGFLGAPPH